MKQISLTVPSLRKGPGAVFCLPLPISSACASALCEWTLATGAGSWAWLFSKQTIVGIMFNK